ncbi:gene transfer agent family protein [Ancylobacter lacus]|uniref:gene transfer agent family protein n=1 Tax=Ancylobacter lacus TaxID=2579970 RepID=UPI001BCF79EA|nr:gene transfer agent family protein [Ancylobacter lacus]MBS7539385.1 gene transfer agent family protein [Ancylobacter lacus]
MANRHRGEIAAEMGGRVRTLVLTLGALAELEEAFGAEDLLALAERFERGRLSARDALRILAAGLRGAGEAVTDAEVAAMTVPGGATGYARLVGALIGATFGAPAEGAGEAAAGAPARPFPAAPPLPPPPPGPRPAPPA